MRKQLASPPAPIRASGSPGVKLRLRVRAAAETALRSGHPWVFADSIREANRPGKLGELAVVYDRKDRFLAIGLFDPDSPIRVRILHSGKPRSIDEAFWKERLEAATQKRQTLCSDRTTGFRWINGESDGWPGLVLDRYDSTLVLKLYTAAWLPWLDALVQVIARHLSPRTLVLRLSRNIQQTSADDFGRHDGSALVGGLPSAPVTFLENGLRFAADVVKGQKTGFFLDQRENRQAIGGQAAGRSVLNAFSFSGGFSLYAARGGARSVLDLDISAHALQAAQHNFELNQADRAIHACNHETVQADTFEWLAAHPDRRFDLIILDPPSLARRETERASAIRAYAKLAALGISHLEPEGVLLACSCSAHVSEAEFFQAVSSAANASNRSFTELTRTGQPLDHPAAFPEAKYLKAVYLRFAKRV